MISDRLKRTIAQLEIGMSARAYIVLTLAPGTALVLVVPEGAENLPVVNPIAWSGESMSLQDVLLSIVPDSDSAEDWGELTRPILMQVSESALHSEPPELRIVEGGVLQ